MIIEYKNSFIVDQSQLAGTIGVSTSYIVKLRKKYNIPCIKLKEYNKVWYKVEDIKNLILEKYGVDLEKIIKKSAKRWMDLAFGKVKNKNKKSMKKESK